MASSYYFSRLEWQSVEHTCGHFEIRLMAHYSEPAVAGSPCSGCAPQGRPVQPHYVTRDRADIMAERANVRDGR